MFKPNWTDLGTLILYTAWGTVFGFSCGLMKVIKHHKDNQSIENECEASKLEKLRPFCSFQVGQC